MQQSAQDRFDHLTLAIVAELSHHLGLIDSYQLADYFGRLRQTFEDLTLEEHCLWPCVIHNVMIENRSEFKTIH